MPEPIKIDVNLMPLVGIAEQMLRLINNLVEGQTPEQKAKLWQWYVDDMSRWRKFWGLEG